MVRFKPVFYIEILKDPIILEKQLVIETPI